MADYYHYRYQCPYIGGTDAQKVRCSGSRICFQDTEKCKLFLRRYCANTHGWKQCSIARTHTKYQRWKAGIRKMIRDLMASQQTKDHRS